MTDPTRLSGSHIVFGLMGKQLSGKSALGGELRRLFGSTDPRADVEFSDPFIEIVNLALRSVWARPDYRNMRRLLAVATHLVLDHPPEQSVPVRLPQRPAIYHTCATNPQIDCPECGLADWVQGVAPGLRLTRENKADHRQVLSWLGIVMREIHGADLYAREIARLIQIAWAAGATTLTAGGVRFPNDANAIKSLGGVVIKVVREEKNDPDATNLYHDQIVPDSVVLNTADGLNYVSELARQIHADVMELGFLRPIYGPAG